MALSPPPPHLAPSAQRADHRCRKRAKTPAFDFGLIKASAIPLVPSSSELTQFLAAKLFPYAVPHPILAR